MTARPEKAALLLIDVINDLEFPGNAAVTKTAEAMAGRLARLADRARAASIPVIYANDNFGRWRSDWRRIVERCLDATSPGRKVVEQLQPKPEDYFVLKPKHSAFYSTTLDLLLKYLGARTMVIAGIATDICILATANDGYMRDYGVVVAQDCVAANTRRRTAAALEQIRLMLKGQTPRAAKISFKGGRLISPRRVVVEARGRARNRLTGGAADS